MHPTRKDELEHSLRDVVDHMNRDSTTSDVQVRDGGDVQVRSVPDTMHLEVDLMYCHIWTDSKEVDEFTIRLATLHQLIENTSIQFMTQAKDLITRVI